MGHEYGVVSWEGCGRDKALGAFLGGTFEREGGVRGEDCQLEALTQQKVPMNLQCHEVGLLRYIPSSKAPSLSKLPACEQRTNKSATSINFPFLPPVDRRRPCAPKMQWLH